MNNKHEKGFVEKEIKRKKGKKKERNAQPRPSITRNRTSTFKSIYKDYESLSKLVR
jgi:hypothetical protein